MFGIDYLVDDRNDGGLDATSERDTPETGSDGERGSDYQEIPVEARAPDPPEAMARESDDAAARSDALSGSNSEADAFDGSDGFVCDPTKKPSLPGACITDVSGVFVAPSGRDGAPGTMADPLRKIVDAITLATFGAKRVLACGGTYNEKVTIDANADALSLYGGLDCTHGWKWAPATPTVLAPTTPGIVLTIRGLSAGVIIEDFGFHALPGVNPGDSSIAVFTSKFTSQAAGVLLRRCDIAAGQGQDGEDQVELHQLPKAPDGALATPDAGAPPMPNACSGVANASVGGGGGPPGIAGNDGMDGTPLKASNKGTARGPSGNGCFGASGANGVGGAPGEGASTWATFNESGWKPTAGQPGGSGSVGQGGGGGASLGPVGGGGGGGAGGCGGAGGAGGTGGGSSIGVLAYQSIVTLEQCRLTASDAGRGGKGASGQVGQYQGYAGSRGGMDGCEGGKGGDGGGGGGGGGGAGGLSAGIVWTGTPPTLDAISGGGAIVGQMGSGGAFGTGGAGVGPGFDGTPGTAGAAAPVVHVP
jgi:hypothetical protein